MISASVIIIQGRKMEFLIIVILIIIGGIYIFNRGDNQKEAAQRIEEQKKKEAEEKAERFKNFCALHPEVRPLSDTVDREANALARSSLPLLSVNIRPTAPTYTQGLYKGSLGDNISQIANAQKKADYESAMATYNENETRRIHAQVESEKIAKRLYDACEDLIKALEKIPGSYEFLEDAKKKRDFAKSKME